MKKIIQLLYILFAVAAFSACSDDNQGEVVSQDLSYQLDANYVFVDIPEKFLFDPSNILYLEGTADPEPRDETECQERWKTDYDNRRNRVHL